MVKVCGSNIIFPCGHRPFICSLHYLLPNHWLDFNQICYITSTHCKGLREQQYFSVCPSVHYFPSWLGCARTVIFFLCVRPCIRPPSVHLSVLKPSPKPLNGTQPNLLHYFYSWYGCARGTLFFRAAIVRPSVRHTISSQTTGRNSTKFAISLPLIVRVCESNIIFPYIRPYITSPHD